MSNCSCIHVDDYDPPKCYIQRKQKAIKEYKCDECGKKIKDEVYEYVFAVYDGYGKFEYRTCLDCVSIRGVFFCNGYEHYAVLEHLYNHIQELGGEISSDCITQLTKGAKDTVCDTIEKYWEEWCEDD